MVERSVLLGALRILRIAHDYSITEIARELKIMPSFISEVERGFKKPSKRLWQFYEDAFGLSKATILMLDDIASRENATFEQRLINVLYALGYTQSIENVS